MIAEAAAGGRSASAAAALEVLAAPVASVVACRGCGCTARNACVVRDGGRLRGCRWSVGDPTLCDACVFTSTRQRGPLDALELLAVGSAQ